MKLWRVIFFDKDSGEHYNRWYGSPDQAEKEGEKLISDKVTDKTIIDTVSIENSRHGSPSLPTVVSFLNQYALVNTGKLPTVEPLYKNDSLGG